MGFHHSHDYWLQRKQKGTKMISGNLLVYGLALIIDASPFLKCDCWSMEAGKYCNTYKQRMYGFAYNGVYLVDINGHAEVGEVHYKCYGVKK